FIGFFESTCEKERLVRRLFEAVFTAVAAEGDGCFVRMCSVQFPPDCGSLRYVEVAGIGERFVFALQVARILKLNLKPRQFRPVHDFDAITGRIKSGGFNLKLKRPLNTLQRVLEFAWCVRNEFESLIFGNE